MSKSTLSALEPMLKGKFAAKQVEAQLKHYQDMVNEFQRGEWEEATLKGGKFIEATLKALWLLVGNTLPRAREFKVDVIIRELERVPAATADDTIRITIPRASRFVYDIASNRGARHDPSEIDPNEMDANTVVANCSWILAEMLRYSQKGVLDLTEAREMVLGLTNKKYSVVENVDGHVYFHLKGLSARDVALLALWDAHPGRLAKDEVVAAAKRHGSSYANAQMGVSRLSKLVDDDGNGNLRLLLPGVAEAERIMANNKTQFDK